MTLVFLSVEGVGGYKIILISQLYRLTFTPEYECTPWEVETFIHNSTVLAITWVTAFHSYKFRFERCSLIFQKDSNDQSNWGGLISFIKSNKIHILT